MAYLKKLSQTVMPRRRPLDDDVEGIRETRTKVSKYPPPKIRSGVQVVHDFPPGCGIMDHSLKNKGKKNSDSQLRTMTSLDKEKSVVLRSFEGDIFNTFKPKALGGNKSSFGLKRPGKVKYWDPIVSKATTIPVISPKGSQARRKRIKEAMMMFDVVYEELCLENRLKPPEEKMSYWRISIEAGKMVRQKKKLMDVEKMLGPVSGVEIGDMFKYRAQLQMVGLHCQPQSGIDYTKIRGKNLAVSIVDSQRYSNTRESRDVLLYCGQGRVQHGDQKLERGNLALKNSMTEESPVRVIRKLGRAWGGKFAYDGLYTVKKYEQKRGARGKMEFVFRLMRLPGQPQLTKCFNANW